MNLTTMNLTAMNLTTTNLNVTKRRSGGTRRVAKIDVKRKLRRENTEGTYLFLSITVIILHVRGCCEGLRRCPAFLWQERKAPGKHSLNFKERERA